MAELVTRLWDDFHLHARQGNMLASVLPYTLRYCARALVMPNLNPPLVYEQDVSWYVAHARQHARSLGYQLFEPLGALYITDMTTPETIYLARRAGVLAGKIYPKGVTTLSQQGVADFDRLKSVILPVMEKVDMVASIHAELPGVPSKEAENACIPLLEAIVSTNKKLRIVIEHVSSNTMVDYVSRAPDRVASTITAHHLVLTESDVMNNGKISQPHNYCKPIAKSADDREALWNVVLTGNQKFFLGSDSAPHPRINKECENPAAGVFTAPLLPELLATSFETRGALFKLEPFVTQYGARFYGLPLNEHGRIRIYKESWVVSDEIDKIVPFWAGRTLDWRVTRIA